MHMERGNEALHFSYDAQGRPLLAEYGGAKYAYVHNLQGDITGLIDPTGQLVVQYSYDAWGRPIGKTGSLADTLGTLNPFRYRGYEYDEETGLYYLRSRYYECVLLRFINADSLYSGNAYAYCLCVPTVYNDSDGHMPVELLRSISNAYNHGLISATIVSELAVLFNANNTNLACHEIAQINVAKQLFDKGLEVVLEYRIPKVGEADIMANNMLWEVKPIGYSGAAQLRKYINATQMGVGASITPMSGIPMPKDYEMSISYSGEVSEAKEELTNMAENLMYLFVIVMASIIATKGLGIVIVF